jgi:hypothetical protein
MSFISTPSPYPPFSKPDSCVLISPGQDFIKKLKSYGLCIIKLLAKNNFEAGFFQCLTATQVRELVEELVERNFGAITRLKITREDVQYCFLR